MLFLDAVERKWIEELGGMNIMFVFNDGSIITPPLNGSILPGVTRDSLRSVAQDAGYTVREEPYSFDQWMDDARSGKLKEAFACGTAAVITPIGEVRSTKGNFIIGNGEGGEVARTLREALVGVQLGQKSDNHGWMTKLA